jgi:hypothetical protein
MQSISHLALRLFYLFALVAGVSAHAIDLSVYALGYAEDHKTVYLLNDEGAAVEIALSTARMVGPYHTLLDAGSDVILRSKKETEEGALTYPPVAQAKLLSDIKEPVMILVPSTESLPYKAIIIDRSLERFPLGSYLLINLSPIEVRGLVGSSKIVVSAESVTTIVPSSEDEDLLDVHFEYERPKGWKTFARTRWVNERNKRSLLLAYSDLKTKRMKIKGIPVRPFPIAGGTAP